MTAILICIRSIDFEPRLSEGEVDMTDSTFYQIQVGGHLGDHWNDWFGGLTIENLPGGEAALCGPLPDQAALYSMLNRIRDVGLTLLAVNRVADNSGKTSENRSLEMTC